MDAHFYGCPLGSGRRRSSSLGTTLTPALLALEDGSLFHGVSIGIEGSSVGEVVFNTSMTGYQEILTHPSYARQIITLTYPQIGNTGVNSEDVESERVWASGLVIRQLPRLASSWRMQSRKEKSVLCFSKRERQMLRYTLSVW